MTFTDDELWIEQQIMRRVLAPGARGMSAADAARQYNESNALTPTDPSYLVPPITVVDRRVSTTPAVWIGCLQCYNEGRLVGDWFPAVDAAGDTTSALHGREIADGTHEELWCMDSEYIPVRHEMDPATATAWAELLTQVPEHERAPFDAWLLDRDWHTEPDDLLLREFDDAYAGAWDSFADYARDYVANTGLLDGLHDDVARYFDHAAYARDLEHGYAVLSAADGGVYVFRDY